MLGRIGTWAARRVDLGSAYPDGYGLGRSVLALATLATLATNKSIMLFPIRSSACVAEEALSLFCRVPSAWLDVSRIGAVALLVLVVMGLWPRGAGIVHWWIVYSFAVSGRVLDGGDAVAANLALLLLPATICDGRITHWSSGVRGKRARLGEDCGVRERARRLIVISSFAAVRVQMAIVYLMASYGKVMAPEWRQGTAMYYWLGDSFYGLPGYMRPVLMPLLHNGPFVLLVTWGVVLIECFLAVAIVVRGRLRKPGLRIGLTLHVLIAVMLGLPTFSLAMMAGLILSLGGDYERSEKERRLRATPLEMPVLSAGV